MDQDGFQQARRRTRRNIFDEEVENNERMNYGQHYKKYNTRIGATTKMGQRMWGITRNNKSHTLVMHMRHVQAMFAML